MWKKRAIFCTSLCFLVLAVLFARLVQIQLVDTKSFSKHNINLLESSVEQRSQSMVVDNGRGKFLDRHGEPLTFEKIPVLILFPFLKKIDWPAAEVARTIGVSEFRLMEAVKAAKNPFAYGEPQPVVLTKIQMEKINSLKIPGVFAVEQKYDVKKNPAEQLLGIVGENERMILKRHPDKQLPPRTLIGLSGLEESFDEFLLAEGSSKLVYHVDGEGAPLFGINVKYVEPGNPFYPINIRTTIDKKLQEAAEQLADTHAIKSGGLVLLDIESNAILAMVSRPSINRKDPFADSGINNMMLKQHAPGSVFKTVVAAAAIDYNLADPMRKFDCDRKINGDPDLEFQHGNLTFSESFARSCNRTFGELSKELKEIDENILEEYAAKLSLVGQTGWEGDVFHLSDFKQLPGEDKGRVFAIEEAKKDDNFAALSGIGQHEVRVTPLSVANMMATIAKAGKKEMVRAATAIEYQNGTSLVAFDKKDLAGDSLAPYTAMKLQQLLRGVVVSENGTGRWFQNLPYEVAGKSGTAETGIFIDDKQLHNKWFAGYFPYKNPRYALVTVNLGVFGNEGAVNPLFADMVDVIFKYDQENGL
ncbi:peptidoglycan D,D-transpeptidase FtsI family protein [Mesobacillus harenae]|uniref:peptidoglycan D,D-transpeptidase FtsI family protein n=1 Tax=Mesobacillus harenae TaxID=2213203 RepID=UPI001580C80D|nr:penicillin-binding transpeptidase domain-containing protein [Mesobacillus harenae]